jgi:hypothetical protein
MISAPRTPRAGKTPLLLAFGEHPVPSNPVNEPGDRQFFRSQVLPFIDRHVIKEKRPATIIHEYNPYFDLGSIDRRDDEQMEHMRKRVAEVERDLNNAMAQSLDRGVMISQNPGWFDWGHMDAVLGINAKNQGRISNIIEPLASDTAWMLWDQAALSDRIEQAQSMNKLLNLQKDYLLNSITIALGRSRRVADLVKTLREKDSERAIIICRGWAHKGMVNLFNKSDFDMSAVDKIDTPYPSSRAIIQSFSGALNEEQLGRYVVRILFSDQCHHPVVEDFKQRHSLEMSRLQAAACKNE